MGALVISAAFYGVFGLLSVPAEASCQLSTPETTPESQLCLVGVQQNRPDTESGVQRMPLVR
jgi:hypothetical protein